MKPKKIRKVLQPIILLYFASFILCNINYVFSQDNEGFAVKQRNAWFYIQRAHPYDTIPSYGYPNAIAQKYQSISANGFRLSGPGSSWVNMGPQPLVGIGGIVSGRISEVVYDERDQSGNTVYIAPAGGGVWKTTDAGTSWVDLSGNPNDETALPTLVSGAIAIDYPHNIIYYGSGTNHYFGTEYMGMGMFKTTNDGQNWIRISNNLPEQTQIFRIAIDPNDNTGNTIYIAEFHGLYKTTDGGSSWFKVLPTNGSDRMCTDICFSPDGSKIYAAGTAPDFWPGSWFNGIGYLRSTDGGANWGGPTSGFPHSSTPHGRTCIAVSNAEESIVYLLSYDNSPFCSLYVYKSTDGGLNFSSYHYPYVSDMDNWNLGGNAGFNQTLKCSDFDPNVVVVGLQNLYKSTNGGTVWSCIGGYCRDYIPHPDFHTIDFNPFDQSSTKIFVGHDGGVSKSDNLGSSWTGLNEDLSLAQVWHVGSNTYNSNQLAAGIEDQDLAYRSQGTTWIDNFLYYDGGLVDASPFKSGRYIGNTCAVRVMYYSTNSGLNFYGALNYYGTTGAWIAVVANRPDLPGTSYLVRYDEEDYQGHHYYRPIYVMKTTDYGANYNPSLLELTHDWINVAPNCLAISQSNPALMIMAVGNSSRYWEQTAGIYSRLIKSTDGGNTWQTNPPLLQCGPPSEVPDRYLTHVEIDPKNEQEIYITMSGYGTRHVYRTTNGGANWSDIDGESPGRLPNNPVNDLIIHYTSPNTKELIVACDVGVYRTDANNISWSSLADGLPNSPVNNLDYNRLSGKLNCATYGRGVWQVQLDPVGVPIYVQDVLYITDNVTVDKQIVVANGGKLILGHPEVNSSITLTFNNGANIVVQDGGEIDASSSVAIALTSSGTWSGIELQGTGFGTLRNCTFSNTTTPVSIAGGLGEVQGILIDNCNFSAPISINTRPNVTIQNSHWNYTAQPPGSIACVYSIGSNNIDINTNYLNASPSSAFIDAVAISVISGQSITIVNNDLNKCSNGIDVHNSSNAFVNQNTITSGSSEQSSTGIFMDYAYSTTLRYNTINDYPTGIYMINSSPTLYINDIDNSTGNQPVGIMLASNSYPRMRPLYDQPYQFWDAGYNFIFNESPTNNQSISFSIDHSLPDVGYGYNRIKAVQYYIDGCNVCNPSEYPWHAQYNCWSELPPNMDKFHFTDPCVIYIEEYTCGPPPGGGSRKSEISEKDPTDAAKKAVPNPDPIIVNRGNGVYDTVKVTSGAQIITNDKSIYFNGVKNELFTNYSTAIELFKQVIQNYQDSTTSILSLKRILTSRDKMTFDSTAYSSLRAYYHQLAQNNTADTSFANIASELAVKCLVRLKNYEQAIGEYENIIANTTDSIKILGCELNIIEIYMMMGSGGDSPGYTGKIAQLKPQTVEDGFRLINEKLNRRTHSRVKEQLPTVFSLSQNYPNPFNPLTKINYAIPKKTNVTLKVYDILGRLVKTLVNEPKEPGYYTVQFDGSAYASGVYFYKIEAGDFEQSRKMVLVK